MILVPRALEIVEKNEGKHHLEILQCRRSEMLGSAVPRGHPGTFRSARFGLPGLISVHGLGMSEPRITPAKKITKQLSSQTFNLSASKHIRRPSPINMYSPVRIYVNKANDIFVGPRRTTWSPRLLSLA